MNLKQMKEKIIEIISHGMEPERAEVKAMQIIILFNQHLIDALKQPGDFDKLINDIFIPL